MVAEYQPYAQQRRKYMSSTQIFDSTTDSPLSIERPIASRGGSSTGFSAFRFASFNPDILNCTCYGPQRWRCSVITSPQVTTHTFFYDQASQAFAAIEWGPKPCVGIRGLVSKQRTSQWLKLPANERHMTMEVCGIVYTWIPSGSSIRLFATSGPPVLLAVIDQGYGSVSIMITDEAVDANLLEVSIVVAVLLLSGRDFA